MKNIDTLRLSLKNDLADMVNTVEPGYFGIAHDKGDCGISREKKVMHCNSIYDVKTADILIFSHSRTLFE